MLNKRNYAFNKQIKVGDGFINGQRICSVSGMRYGLFPMSYNGCGVIALYNLMYRKRRRADPADIAREIYPYSAIDTVEIGLNSHQTVFYFKAGDHRRTLDSIKNILVENNLSQSRLNDVAESKEASRMLLKVIKVFSYGFIVLISLIAASNVFNTISTNILLRRREFAMLKSIGITGRSLSRMMNYECIIYGLKGLLLGLPTSFVITFLIWKSTDSAYVMPFYIPWMTVAIAIGSVFIVVFASMLYAMRLIAKDNPIDTLKNENL